MVNGKIDLKALARLGAEIALKEHLAKVEELKRFLRKPKRRSVRSAPKRKRMSAAARKAISQRMKRYWAERRTE